MTDMPNPSDHPFGRGWRGLVVLVIVIVVVAIIVMAWGTLMH